MMLVPPPPPLPFLSPVFGDHMVLQRGRPNAFWGWSTPGTRVRVSAGGSAATTTVGRDGKWLVRLMPPRTGGPYTVDVRGTDHRELTDVLVGDVWLCTGQSNMEFGLSLSAGGAEAVARANDPGLRLYMVGRQPALAPRAVAPGAWSLCTPETVVRGGWGGFSAVGYHFGRTLRRQVGVPIGLVQDVWGGTNAESWISREGLRPLGDFDAWFPRIDAAAKAAGTSLPLKDPNDPNVPTSLSNGMIEPIVPLAIKGAIWYQGENNAGRAEQYRRVLPALIADWRRRFGQGDVPFYIVSLAAWGTRREIAGDDDWAELREAQALTARTVKNSGLALAIDVGDATDIHPKEKRTVGERLARIALARDYARAVAYQGPTFRDAKAEEGAIRVRFDHAEGGLMVRGSAPGEFEIAGADRQWRRATARVEGASVIVSAAEVPRPVALRYAWQGDPEATLFNAAGLPAVPFRTDRWPGRTAGRK